MKRKVWTSSLKLLIPIMALQLVILQGDVSAAPITNMSQVNSWMFGQSITSSRDRELIRVIKPDLVQRGMYEWVGTQMQDRGYAGFSDSVKSLQNSGIAIGGGVSAHWWAPKYETLASGVNVNEAGFSNTDVSTGDYCHIDPNTTSGMNQLIFKAEKQIDMGINQIEFDELYNQSNARNIFTTLRNYANSKGKPIILGANNYWYTGSDGLVDYNMNDIPFDACEGVNEIPKLRAETQDSKVPVLYFQDHFGPGTTGPSDPSYYPGFFRAGYAQVLASGGFPGEFKSWMNSYDTYQNGCFSIVAGLSKFIKENAGLWHNLTYLNPSTLSSSAGNVYLSAFGQSGRTILHVVNGNYNSGAKNMYTQNNFTVKIALSTAPTNIWMTTPDKLANSREQGLSYTYSGGVATITIPQLIYNNVVIIEQGTKFMPTHTGDQVVMPFPNPTSIATGNNFRFSAVQTEGWNDSMNWYVNNILWGNSTVGTIDVNGFYIAPASIPNGGTVTIKAESKDDSSVSASVNVNVTNALSIGWTENFANDTNGNRPESWQVVNGNGDWRIDTDNGTKVLHNYNISEGKVEQFQTGVGGNVTGALHEPMIVGGNNNWTNYTYNVSVKPTMTPYTWYGINSEKIDTYAGVVFRFKDAWNYYVYRMAEDGYVRLYKVVGGVESKVGGDTAKAFFSVGSYTNLRVDVNGSNFTFYVNGTQVRSDSDSSIGNGKVGCLSNMMDNYFSSISVGNVGSGTSTGIVSGATYKIISKSSGKALEQVGFIKDDKVLIDQWTDNGGVNQRWLIDDMGSGYYKLTNINSGKCLDVPGSSNTENLQLDQYTDNGGDNQRFKITDLGGGNFSIIVKFNGKAVDLSGYSAEDGGVIDQYTYSGNINQQWLIQKQ